MKQYKRFFAIFIAVLGAYLISTFLMGELFLARSPRLNPNFPGSLIARIENLFQNSTATTAEKVSVEFLVARSKDIAPGVKAATYGNNSYTEYDMDKVKWIVIELRTKDGRVEKIRVPEGVNIRP